MARLLRVDELSLLITIPTHSAEDWDPNGPMSTEANDRQVAYATSLADPVFGNDGSLALASDEIGARTNKTTVNIADLVFMNISLVDTWTCRDAQSGSSQWQGTSAELARDPKSGPDGVDAFSEIKERIAGRNR
jgi:hypothetical protein